MSLNAAVFSSERHDWETPDEFFKRLDHEFRFTLDVCATKVNAKCRAFLSPDDDGLTASWGNGEVCWMNPPYGKEIARWMEKAVVEAKQGRSCVVCLVPARTDTAWWHDFAMQGEIRFIRGRLRFKGAKYSAPFPSAIVVFDARKGGLMTKAGKRQRPKSKPKKRKPSAPGRSDPGRLKRRAVTK